MYKMPSGKIQKPKNTKLLKIDVSSGSDSDASEHELSYYGKDKVRLMKEVLKLIKPKKIKSMAPDCIKNLDIVEINSMLLEELLGISNKRLHYIFNGENVDRETSSSESEEEKQPIDVISLDDISDDDDIELCISQNERDSLETGGVSKKCKKHKHTKVKVEVSTTNIKMEKEKSKKDNKKKSKKVAEAAKQFENLKEADRDKLMSVLELLELQARARAIRSQLAIETDKKATETQPTGIKLEESSDSDAVIVESPQHKEIVITSSESEEDGKKVSHRRHHRRSSTSALLNDLHSNLCEPLQKKQKKQVSQTIHSNSIDEEENKVDNSTVNLVYSDDEAACINEASKSKENSDCVNKKRKEKLLAKLQKIKLIRNKVAISNKTSTVSNELSETINEPNDNTCNKELTVELCAATTDPIASENILEDIVEVSVTSNEDFSTVENKKDLEIEVVDTKAPLETVDSKIVLQKDMSKNVNVSYCDNDEIVINLDEDEMNGIENV